MTVPPESAPRRSPARQRVVSQAAIVAAAMAVGNVLSYLLSVTASRRLGPEQFGALGALLGLIVVGYVVALALQMVTTRRLATGEETLPGALTRAALWASWGLGALGLALAAPVKSGSPQARHASWQLVRPCLPTLASVSVSFSC